MIAASDRDEDVERSQIRERWFCALETCNQESFHHYCLQICGCLIDTSFPKGVEDLLRGPLARLALEAAAIERLFEERRTDLRKQCRARGIGNSSIVNSLVSRLVRHEEEAKVRLVGRWYRELTPKQSATIDGEVLDPSMAHAEATNPKPKKTKRSTEKGEARAKIVSALTEHHRYADGGCLNHEPIGNNELARNAKVAKRTTSAFFSKEFKGHANYKRVCDDARNLITALKMLNDEFSPHILIGSKLAPEQGEAGNV